MADSALIPSLAPAVSSTASRLRHTAVVRVTHWVSTLCFLALLVTGVEMIFPHPRFYWGETGNVLTPSLFELPIPASRSSVKTGYAFVLKDQNGWSRSLHFQAGWFAVFAGLVYGVYGLLSGHFRRNLLPVGADRSWRALSREIGNPLRFRPPGEKDTWSYNLLQRLAYLSVIFVLTPFMIWTGLAMSPGFTSAFPASVTAFGGQQSARTLHFFGFLFFVLFLFVHIAMVCLAGFRSRMRAMLTGQADASREKT